MNAQTEVRLPALVGGGHVAAIVPQTFEETWRIAKAVLAGGLAPAALIGKKQGDDAVSAVAVAIMSGAELGLKPMVALRSFTVINGKPALYGDGLINVVRMSGKVAYLRTGCETRDGRMVGFCEAKRSDTGEDKRVEFSQDDAERAGLWQSEATIRKQVWENGNRVWKDNQPNDSPWFRFPQRMLAWRAAGYCLRELFGDVLGGIRDEFEMREIEGEYYREPERVAAPTPPSPPSPPSPPAAKQPAEPVEIDGELADGETGELFEQAAPTPPPAKQAVAQQQGDATEFEDPEKILADAEAQFAAVQDEETYEEVRTEFAHYQETMFPPDWERLVAIMQRAYERATMTPEQREAIRNHPINGG